MTSQSTLFKPYIAIPQDHGSWVFILSPLIIGLFAGEKFSQASIALIIASMSGFLIRQPVIIAIKSYSGRRSKSDLTPAGFWIFLYGIILLISITWLVLLKQTHILYLGIPAIPIFTWHLWLISRREERKQAGIEIIATGVLALTAPAAFWIGKNTISNQGWVLWILVWFQSAASIVYAYLRLEQRQWKIIPDFSTRITAGKRALLYTAFNFLLSISLGLTGITPHLLWIAYLAQLLESIWGTIHPAVRANPISIGVRQLIVSSIYTALFILCWRYG